ncbi:hypothetical protein GXB81_18905 [Paraburkholderia sp. Ac-20336]|uniref:hypothetical protein n=1 Tax=Paraburkholderia sp. Ac-20336 TaxID=2703886 RepID=UPI0019813049|nr:hypothetical protein [Paraburkholderia sp. Ac-20336]MBN3805103.1 hypothetical protein [Paraburkholderia sp. Ac-20336]
MDHERLLDCCLCTARCVDGAIRFDYQQENLPFCVPIRWLVCLFINGLADACGGDSGAVIGALFDMYLKIIFANFNSVAILREK